MATSDQAVLDLLSEMIAVERDGQRLYAQLLADAPAELHPKLIEYTEQSRRDGLVLEEAVRRLGGDPDYVSPGAEVVHDMTQAVVDATERATERRWMYQMLHIITFETRDRMIWELLDELADKLEDTPGRSSAPRRLRSSAARPSARTTWTATRSASGGLSRRSTSGSRASSGSRPRPACGVGHAGAGEPVGPSPLVFNRRPKPHPPRERGLTACSGGVTLESQNRCGIPLPIKVRRRPPAFRGRVLTGGCSGVGERRR